MGRIIRTLCDEVNETLKLTNFTEKELKRIYEPGPGLFIAESSNVIRRALKAGYEPICLLMDETNSDSGIINDLNATDIPIYILNHNVFTNINGYELTRGALAAFKRSEINNCHEIIETSSKLVILEDIVNPTNIGAIFRSAAALGMDGIILNEACCDPLYRRSSRVAMGTCFQIPWAYWNDKSNTICQSLNAKGFDTVAMALTDQSISIKSNMLKNSIKTAIFMGNEGYGLSESTINHSKYTVKLPMFNDVDSLNVAAASAIAFWELGPTVER